MKREMTLKIAIKILKQMLEPRRLLCEKYNTVQALEKILKYV